MRLTINLPEPPQTGTYNGVLTVGECTERGTGGEEGNPPRVPLEEKKRQDKRGTLPGFP
jgi:hypothetical protein